MDFNAELARFTSDSTLPDWVAEAVKGIVSEAQKSTALNTELHLANLKIQALTLELAHHCRMRFGAKSEAMSVDQLDLFMDDLVSDRAELEARINAKVDQEQKPPKTKRLVAGRQAFPDHLERVIYRHDLASCDCGKCGKPLVKIGEDITEQLDVEPARFFVNQHIRPQMACRHCETVTAAPIPAAIIDGGMAAPGLLTWVAVCKFVDHLPLYRVEQIAERTGVSLSRSTMAAWIGTIGVWLEPLVDRLSFYLRQRSIWHADETPIAQLAPGKGKTKKAYLWAYRSNALDDGPPIVVFEYQPGRGGKYAHAFLSGWQGHLMVDDYSGYKGLFRAGVTELACWAHARRKLFDLHAATKSPIAEQALKWISALYGVEKKGKDVDCAARQRLRQEEAKPLLDSFHSWLTQIRPTIAPGSSTIKALDYTLRRWPALIRYAETGNLPIDNNPVENVIRPIAIGKKNWLFVGSERAGQRAAALQSLFATAKLNGLDPYAWLKMVLEELPTCKNSDIDNLLPFRRTT
jgi:transposase